MAYVSKVCIVWACITFNHINNRGQLTLALTDYIQTAGHYQLQPMNVMIIIIIIIIVVIIIKHLSGPCFQLPVQPSSEDVLYLKPSTSWQHQEPCHFLHHTAGSCFHLIQHMTTSSLAAVNFHYISAGIFYSFCKQWHSVCKIKLTLAILKKFPLKVICKGISKNLWKVVSRC